MMTTLQAQIPFVDTCPEDLTHSTGTPLLPALATKTMGQLEMRVLGASHQIRIGRWTETLACQSGLKPHLPSAVNSPGYTYNCAVHQHTPAKLAAQARSIAAEVEAAGGLLVKFQGDPLALTGITATEQHTHHAWKTWHIYPTTGQIVTTQSKKRRMTEHDCQEGTA